MRRLDGVHADISKSARPRRVALAVHSRSEKHHHGAPRRRGRVQRRRLGGGGSRERVPRAVHAPRVRTGADGPELHRNARGSRGDSRGRHCLRRLFRDEPRGDWRDGANLGDAPRGEIRARDDKRAAPEFGTDVRRDAQHASRGKELEHRGRLHHPPIDHRRRRRALLSRGRLARRQRRRRDARGDDGRASERAQRRVSVARVRAREMHHRSARGWTRGRREGEDARRNVEGERRDFESRRVGGAGDVERDESWRRFRRDARDRLPPDACAESSPFFANVRRAVDRAEFSRGREDVPETTRERVGGGEADAANDHPSSPRAADAGTTEWTRKARAYANARARR